MLAERLRAMAEKGISFDLETWKLINGLAAPRPVCGSVGWLEDGKCVGHLLDREAATDAFNKIVADDTLTMVGANIAYDIVVQIVHQARLGIDIAPVVFQMLEEGRVYDLQIAEALDAIAGGHLGKDPRTGQDIINPETKRPGRYSLAACVSMVLGRDDAKINNEWKLRYGELDGVPHDQWAPAARDYPVDDARNTIECALAQAGHLPKVSTLHNWGRNERGQVVCTDCGCGVYGKVCTPTRPHRNLHDLAFQQRGSVALAIAGAWGFRVDQSKVDIIERHALRDRVDGAGPFVEAGVIRPDGSENQAELKRRVAVAYGATELCPVCGGTGKVLSAAAKPTRCRKCAGTCVNGDTGTRCDECDGVGKKVYGPFINCCVVDPENPKKKTKTCDGSGLLLGDDVPRTETGGISAGRGLLFDSGDDFLTAYGEYGEDDKVLDVYVDYLRRARACTKCGEPGNKKGPHLCAEPAAAEYRDIPLTLGYNALLATGRVSCSGATQLFPRWPGYIDEISGEYVPSLRECIVPRDGYVFSSEDYSVGELFAHAQSCIWLLGYSDLAQTLLAGRDPHAEGAAAILGTTYENFMHLLKVLKDPKAKGLRQGYKPFSFGKPTGMGDAKLCTSNRMAGVTACPNGPMWVIDDDGNKVRGYKGTRFCIIVDGADRCGWNPDGSSNKVTRWGSRGREQKLDGPTCSHCLEVAMRLGKAWKFKNRENVPYFTLVQNYVEHGMAIPQSSLDRWPWLQDFFEAGQQLDPGQIMQHVTGRIRGGMKFSELGNSFFQGLIGDITKAAFWRVTTECLDRTRRVSGQMYENSRPSKFGGGVSPLYGSHAIGFFHDEVFLEHPRSIAPEGAVRVQEIMEEEMMFFLPDVAAKVKAEPTLMEAWDKRASYVTDADGRLAVWRPK